MSPRSRRASPGATTAPSRRCPRTCSFPTTARRAAEDGKRKTKSGRRSTGCARRSEQSRRASPCRTAAASQSWCRKARPSSAAGGGLTLETPCAAVHLSRRPTANEQVRALTVFLVNRRAPVHRFYADVSFVFQARLELVCDAGLPAAARSLRLSVRRLRSARRRPALSRRLRMGRRPQRRGGMGCEPRTQARRVTRVWTDPLPQAEVERVAPNEDEELKSRVTFGMEALAERAGGRRRDAWPTRSPICRCSTGNGSRPSAGKLGGLPARRRETAERLIAEMETARKRIARGHRHPVSQRHRATAPSAS